MSFKMTYKLIQQTPLIHFQHDQSGATLRATEVKPKLDKFIIEKMGWKDKLKKEKERKKIKETYATWFIGDTDALNYKMRIIATGAPKKSRMIDAEIECYHAKKKYFHAKKNCNDKKAIKQLESEKKQLESKRNAEINSMFFGNMVSGKGAEYEENVRNLYKETIFYEGHEQISLEISCFVENLKTEIDKYIEEFFIVHNFGTRQSKGFGGFVAVKNGDEHKAKDPIKTLSEQGYRFFYADVNGDTSYTAMLNHAKNVYVLMKSGYNYDTKVNGYMQRYFIDDYFGKNFGGDKDFIKYHKSLTQRLQDKYNYNKYVFSRALLGLADYYDFKIIKEDINDSRVDIFCLGENDFEIERFKSPVTIKIIKNKLIFLFGSFDEICNKTFYFSPKGIPKDVNFDKKTYNQKKNYILSHTEIFKEIQTPKKFDNEDITSFINIFVEHFMKERKKFTEFKDGSIRKSTNLELIVPKHIERSV